MANLKTSLILLLILSSLGCRKNDLPKPPVIISEPSYDFSIDHNYIRVDGNPVDIKGVVYVPCYPGYLPWEIEQSTSLPEQLRNSIVEDLENIKSMGANTIRFWGAPAYCYQAVKESGDLYFLQTIWIDGEQPDFHEPAFKAQTKAYIREVINRIYSVYQDSDPPLLAYIVGNELSESSIKTTNAANPSKDSYSGRFISADQVNAAQVFIAEMADYVKTYEYATYGNESLVSYANDIRTPNIIDVPFLDFISHNAYSYAVPYYRPQTLPGSNSGTLFQGWVEEVKAKHPDMPLLITETGLSVSPNAPHVGPPNYGYGGNTEIEQATGLLQNINDIKSANSPIAGVCIHEYLDAWWKFGSSSSQEPGQVEEWFGMARFNSFNNWYKTEFRSSYDAIKSVWK